MRRSNPTSPRSIGEDEVTDACHRFVSVKTLAAEWDCSKTTVSRLLEAAGVPAYYFGSGRNGAKRYRRQDVDEYLRHIDKA
ncbi:MAG: hypothetical protein H6819_07050 [Phycisphaerales bacterium]|nr:hypothetical protein [Phycisphaerales bacterium]MCB9855339.1 hypothetical protein [Phycisphaerales bacterium]MCB9862932.1 hypothetical protein [Phycisphaerales bacterium]